MNQEDLKQKILHDLKELFLNRKEKEYYFLSFDFNNTSILNIYKQTQIFPKCYIREKDSLEATASIGKILSFTNKNELKLASHILKSLPQVRIIGAHKFMESNKDSNQLYYFLPRIQIIKKEEKTILTLFIKNSDEDFSSALDFITNKFFSHKKEILGPNTHKTNEEKNTIIKKDSDFINWTKDINLALNKIKNNHFKKVVLAREIIKENQGQNEIEKILEQWDEKKENYFHYILQFNAQKAFISLTPERLFKVDKNIFNIDIIAGTRPRGKNPTEDAYFKNQLIHDQKELEEHEVVASNILEGLNKTCHQIKKIKDKEILQLKNVQHLYGSYRAKVNKNTNFHDLIDIFHPTPAVGGHPRKAALDFINKTEQFDREFYAAPIGYFSQFECEFAVGIRSIYIKNGQSHIYGGCGIVEGSVPENEWNETLNKMKHFYSDSDGQEISN